MATPTPNPTNRILIIVTSAGEYESAGYRTGLWLGELTHFYDVAEAAGFDLTIASVDGGRVPIDPESLAHDVLADQGTAERYADRTFMNLLEDTVAVADVRPGDHDAIYLTGGHGTMFDFPRSKALGELVAAFHDGGRVVSAVCHGPCGLLETTLADGQPLLRGREVTGFSWPEETGPARGRRPVQPGGATARTRRLLQHRRGTLRPVRGRGRPAHHRPEPGQRDPGGRGGRTGAALSLAGRGLSPARSRPAVCGPRAAAPGATRAPPRPP
ncbi:type 1 glutamine amidotransferase domain-containing protein [Streptomyces albidoflavus]|uniref:type 1 glutamine amidotransferase domain-containing protein n=1 Tax=Streptomyces albidoflavus TaxID=1886 RepID=UPI0033D32648